MAEAEAEAEVEVEAEAEAEAVAVGLLNLQPVALPISFGKTIKKSWVLPGRKTQVEKPRNFSWKSNGNNGKSIQKL